MVSEGPKEISAGGSLQVFSANSTDDIVVM